MSTIAILRMSFSCGFTPLTNFLGTHRLIPNAILMDFYLSRKPLAIESRANEGLWHFDRASTLDLDEAPLFDYIGHFLFLLFPFVCFLLEIIDLLHDIVQAMTVRGAVRNRTDKGSIWILKRLLYL